MNSNCDIWLEGVKRPDYPKLNGDLQVDTAIIGGGITGIISAYLLAKAGHGVALLEKGRIGEETTSCTTAFLTQSVDTSYRDLIFMLGESAARQVAESHRAAIDLIERIIIEEKIDCDFRRVPNYLIARSKREMPRLYGEFKAMKSLGLPVSYRERNKDLNFDLSGYLELDRQATFHPIKFITALAAKAQQAGAKILEHTEASKAEKTENGWLITVHGSVIRAKNLIASTYEPFGQPIHLYFKKALYRSYVCEFDALPGTLRPGLYEDLSRPYHYFKIDDLGNRCRIIFGGEDHRADIRVSAIKNFTALERHAGEMFGTANLSLRRRWSGPILEPIDGLPYIGLDKRSGFYCAFGFSGNGLTYAAIAAGMFKELIMGDTGPMSPYGKLYRVNRLPSFKSMLVKGEDYLLIFFGGAVKNLLSFSRK